MRVSALPFHLGQVSHIYIRMLLASTRFIGFYDPLANRSILVTQVSSQGLVLVEAVVGNTMEVVQANKTGPRRLLAILRRLYQLNKTAPSRLLAIL